MNKTQKIILLFIGFCMVMVVGLISYNIFMPKPEITPDEIEVSERTTATEDVDITENQKGKEYVNVFFIGENSNKEEVYKAVKRVYDKTIDGSKLNCAISALMNGPNSKERSLGVYTEIPSGVSILHLSEQSNKVIIDLSSDFVNNAGAESLYKRIYQLIKTANQNTSLPVYLYIDGKMANVIGGDGLILSQPLSKTSLGN